ncbi:DNA methyltransferase [Maritimibacter alexandrii]|uniref:DNA methyltransferase n=1 Tax=Maritimibacter alexandrii TaxID=2570355 RepID=UPI001109372C|nr:DNA methyltransferase [Maritimibacter alexandrii]
MKDATDLSAWPADQVCRRAVVDLVPYAKNSRTHSSEQVDQLVASIREWGWTMPVLIDEAGGVIAGHGRIMAAERLGLDEVPCMVATGWSDAKKRAYVIADNKLAENADWDEAALQEEMRALAELEFDMTLIGFDEDELADLILGGGAGLTDPDAAPPVSDQPISRPGDLWRLGNHTLLCGDSTSAEDVGRLLGDVRPHLMVTDPPYGVNYDPAWRAAVTGSAVASGKVQNDDRADWREAWDLFPGDVAYVWHGALHNVEVAASLEAARFAVRSQIVWVKTRAPISRGHYHWQHEPAFYAEREAEGPEGFSVDQESLAYLVRAGKTASWRGGRKQTTVWFIEHLKNDTGHGTQKPVECMRRPIVNNSSPGQAIYEPFCGSGTTVIAGEIEGRHVYAMELDPTYVDVIVRRWQEFTGAEARLDGTDQTFAEVSAARGAG